MKNSRTILFSLLMSAATLLSLSACITEECTREGLTAYMRGPNGCGYVSVCTAGVWVDFPTESDSWSKNAATVFSQYPHCNTILCYKDAVSDCECADNYSANEREVHPDLSD